MRFPGVQSFRKLNRNVQLGLSFTFFETASASIRSGEILSAYIYLITKSNSFVGYVQGVNGILQLASAVPAGWVADAWRRDYVLRGAACIGAAAAITLAASLIFRWPIWTLFVAMSLLGLYRGFNNPSLEAIWADSVAAGRSKLYTVKYVTQMMASGTGPVLSIIMFQSLGDEWKVGACRLVVLVGLSMFTVPLFILCSFKDEHTLGQESQPIRQGTPSPEQQEEEDKDVDRQAPGCCAMISPSVAVATAITASDLFGALASGMTIKFFPLFFMQECLLQPVFVSAISAVNPISISTFAVMADRIGRRLGRVQTALITRALDVVLLVAMAYVPVGHPMSWQTAALVCIHILRSSCANCARPLVRSVLMDHVPPRHRGKVNALESVRTFSWSGSAALGGYLVEVYGFQHTFLLTAVLKAAGWFPLLPALFYVTDGVCTCGSTRAGKHTRQAKLSSQQQQPDRLHAAEQGRSEAIEGLMGDTWLGLGDGCQQ
ncbi:hypothetical protein WJX84_002708 [Apatococcus fuscideae]|uniref:Major facilitator superfamily (MFS) profile domain-containing protein n=1 Tax=Apatococcus fuscideae TaxID=2026836 RepID=A0AAW1T7A8_9CHLO